MSKTGRPNHRRNGRAGSRPARPERRISVRAVRRDPPDLRKLSRAVIALALAEAEAEAQSAATQSDEGETEGAKSDTQETGDGR